MNTFTWLLILILLHINFFNFSFSQTIVNTLPGFPGQLPFKLETGYVGLGEDESKQLFYYFVESERNPPDDPLIISIAGGPGCSALRAFFYQFGPLKFDYANSVGKLPQLKLNPYGWHKVANIIYVDASRCGFTYAKTAEANKTSDTISSAAIYEFLMKWIVDHPKYINSPLYVIGISYAGILVPVIVQNIINGNEAGNFPKLNIKGYLSGNPLTDRNIDFNARIPYAHQFALLSDELFESATSHCNGNYVNVNPTNSLCLKTLEKVDECLDKIYTSQILEPICISELTSKRMLQQQDSTTFNSNLLLSPQLPEGWCREDTYPYATTWASDKTVQKALNVREGTIQEWLMCNSDHYLLGRNDTDTYKYDITSSLIYHQNLTKQKQNVRALIFSGDHDMVFPYVGTRKWIHALKLNVDRSWSPWSVNNQVAGYTEMFSHNNYSMTYATVKGAGHSAPEFKGEQCLAMIDRWFNNAPL